MHIFFMKDSPKQKNSGRENASASKNLEKFLMRKSHLREILEFTILLPEGLAAIRQISFIHDDPRLTYSHYMEPIDKTITFIDKEYN